MKTVAKSALSLADVFFPALEGPRVLLYHQVGTNLGREMEVSLRTFQDHLDWIERVGRVVALEAALANRHASNGDDVFVLSFDDGYHDVFKFAFPLLRERRLPFTLYLNTEPLETGIAIHPESGAEPLNWAEVETMMGSGLMTVGAHTHSHVDVRSIDTDALRNELDLSNQLIEKRLGLAPRHFAYPWGYWSESAEALVRERYQTAALAAVSSMTADMDLCRLPRVPIQKSDGVTFFKRKVRTGLRAEEWIRQRVKGYTVPPMSGGTM